MCWNSSKKKKGAVALKGLCTIVNRSLIVENSHPWYASLFSQMRKRNVYFSVEEEGPYCFRLHDIQTFENNASVQTNFDGKVLLPVIGGA